MWWCHIRFSIAFVLVTLICVLGNIADLAIKSPNSRGIDWNYYKDAISQLKQDIYGGS